jgi:hypothetical protein
METHPICIEPQRPSYAGLFEAHVTVEAHDLHVLERFRDFCQTKHVKTVQIELPQGVHRSQPMTCTRHQGTLSEVLAEAQALARLLSEAGFPVLRIKLEAAPFNADVPQTDEAAGLMPSANYFEYHVKVLLPEGAPLDALLECCRAHGAHLSTNAMKQRSGGRLVRFATLRCFGEGQRSADARVARLKAALSRLGQTEAKTVCEYTVFDSNANLDDAWMDA